MKLKVEHSEEPIMKPDGYTMKIKTMRGDGDSYETIEVGPFAPEHMSHLLDLSAMLINLKKGSPDNYDNDAYFVLWFGDPEYHGDEFLFEDDDMEYSELVQTFVKSGWGFCQHASRLDAIESFALYYTEQSVEYAAEIFKEEGE